VWSFFAEKNGKKHRPPEEETMWNDKRGILNRYITELEAVDEPLLPYPAQFSVSSALRNESAARGDPSFIAMWAGQGAGLLRHQTAAELFRQLVADSYQLISRLAKG